MGTKKYTLEEVSKMLKAKGFILLEKEYINRKTPMLVQCENGHTVKKTLNSVISSNTKCNKCNGTYRYTYQDVLEICKGNNFELISKKYINARTPLEVKCEKGHITRKVLPTIKNSYCDKCARENTRGENHYNYNPNKNYEEREKMRDLRENVEWREEVYKKDNYTCKKCNEKGGRLNAHHIYNYWSHVDLRFNVDNGVTLCKNCHKDFHSKYGVKYNNKEQLDEFLIK